MAKAPKKKSVRRRNFLINPKFQFALIAYNLLFSLLCLSIFWIGMSYFVKNLFMNAQILGLSGNAVFFEFLRNEVAFLKWILFVVAFWVMAIISITGLFISHRIAGPLYRLQKQLEKDTANAKLSPVQFRKGDFFTELATGYTLLAETLTGGRASPETQSALADETQNT